MPFLCVMTMQYSDVTTPLWGQPKKDAKLKWSSQCEAAIKTLKDALVSDKLVTYWDQSRKVEIVVDRDQIEIAAALY